MILSDRKCLVDLIEQNCVRNAVEAKVIALDWGGDLQSARPPFDVVILSDVVTKAYASDYPKLLASLSDLTHDDSIVLLSVELRSQVRVCVVWFHPSPSKI